jgi:hypothetical protein
MPTTVNSPFCSNCGFDLTNLPASSKCPECGKLLVEVLARRNTPLAGGKRFTSPTILLGYPLVSIALGRAEGELRGHARGIIAIGDIATGALAIGGLARGIIAIGGCALGLFSLGGCSLGLLCAIGGLSLGAVALGGCAIGIISFGGLAVGHWAFGGLTLRW